MANEFIIKHGFHSDGNSQITGSLNISDSLTVNGGAVGAAFPFTGDAQITGSLSVSGSVNINNSLSNIIISTVGSASSDNTAVTGNHNIVMGMSAAEDLGASSDNIIIGNRAASGSVFSATKGQNIIIGTEAGSDADMVDSANVVYIGYQAGFESTGASSVFVGAGAGKYADGNENVAVGGGAMTSNAGQGGTPLYNVAMGNYAMSHLWDGNHNVAIGHSAMRNPQQYTNTSTGTVAIGSNAIRNNRKNNYTVGAGYQSLYNLRGNDTDSGNHVTAIGAFAGFSEQFGYNHTLLGYRAGYNLTASTGSIVIGFDAASGTSYMDHQLFIGSGSTALISGSLADGGLLIRGQVSASSYIGDGSGLSGISVNPFPFTGDAQITGSLLVTGSLEIIEGEISSSRFFFQGASGLFSIGLGAINKSSTNVVIGQGASATVGGYRNIVIGNSTTVGGAYRSVLIGESINAPINHAVIIGDRADATVAGSISIGSLAGNGVSAQGINIGYQAKGSGVKNIVLNSTYAGVTPTKANTFGIYMTDASPNFEIEATGSSTLSGSSFTIEKSGSTVFNVIGSEGTLFSVSDNLTTGSLFSVKDLSGIPILDVTANSTIPDVVTVGQSNLLVDSGSLEVVGSISASGDVTGRLQRPTQEFGTNFTASADYSGYYLRTGGNVTCSIQANALPSINSEFDFFQTSSAGNMLFETGSTSVILNSKNNNLNLAGQFSSATLKYVGNNTFDLMGDLT